MSNKKIKKIFTSALFLPHLYYRIIPRKEKDMELNKTFKITFWAKKHKKHITRNAKWTDLCRYFTSKKGVPCITYYDLDNNGYRTATTSWKVQL
jgi:hypothetical protein|tara:strand:+ start:22 stop:303 length:282 start_codon:yes stop_codon:yes gene_type:complete